MERLYSGKAFQLDKTAGLGVLNFDLQGERVNKLSRPALEELEKVIEQINAGKTGIKALLLRSLKKDSFIVGADINVIEKLNSASEAEFASSFGQRIFSKFEDLKIPTLAAIDGPCMGGGTELILSCKHRIVSDSDRTAIALPEVKLGILPGWGGCYRLPRLVGLMNGIDMILTGKSIRADKAQKMGLVDMVVPKAIFSDKSLELGLALADGKFPRAKERVVPMTEKLLTKNPLGRKFFFSKARQQVMKSTRGHYPSPLKSIALLESHFGARRDVFMQAEAKAFGELANSPESRNLVKLFLLTESAKKETGTTLAEEQIKALPPLKSVGVLGAGVMGGGIAAQCAISNIPCTVKDLNYPALGKALAHARGLFEGDLKKKRIKVHQLEARMGLIRSQLDFTGFKGLDLIVEAVVENLDVKKKVFSELENEVRADAIIASNTSSLRLTDMLPAFKDPSRFVGLHFFNPVHKMPLVEVITHEKVSPEVVARTVLFSRAIGKTPVVVKDGPGFLVNRLLVPWLNEAAYCLEEGHDMAQMDKALKDFGMPMGPFELFDEIGLDVACKVGHILADAFGDRSKPGGVLDALMTYNKKVGEKETALMGRKSGAGFYLWDKPGGRRQELNKEKIDNIVFKGSRPTRPEASNEALVRRMIYPMINEAAEALFEGIVSSPAQLDLAMIFGTGFPPFRGGLCRYADSIGLKKIEGELERLAGIYGKRFAPTAGLKKYLAQGSFYK